MVARSFSCLRLTVSALTASGPQQSLSMAHGTDSPGKGTPPAAILRGCFANDHPDSSGRSADNQDVEKTATTEQLEVIHTNERVPGHDYYEKNGLRTYGDGEDHDHEPPMTFRRAMSLLAMALRKSTDRELGVTPSAY